MTFIHQQRPSFQRQLRSLCAQYGVHYPVCRSLLETLRNTLLTCPCDRKYDSNKHRMELKKQDKKLSSTFSLEDLEKFQYSSYLGKNPLPKNVFIALIGKPCNQNQNCLKVKDVRSLKQVPNVPRMYVDEGICDLASQHNTSLPFCTSKWSGQQNSLMNLQDTNLEPIEDIKLDNKRSWRRKLGGMIGKRSDDQVMEVLDDNIEKLCSQFNTLQSSGLQQSATNTAEDSPDSHAALKSFCESLEVIPSTTPATPTHNPEAQDPMQKIKVSLPPGSLFIFNNFAPQTDDPEEQLYTLLCSSVDAGGKVTDVKQGEANKACRATVKEYLERNGLQGSAKDMLEMPKVV
ncbi:unnamed protein product [Notodromas monacha]|uniref:Uncharacterized protein n=1 Tax=Notodromas monacha TaxID=399045 RepID=A0A7R9BXZ8_9CRUS|nr:unnamed protein product [Notodromas monacha]CAG0922885.1 unnamed protein product [Notodromas monacha]